MVLPDCFTRVLGLACVGRSDDLGEGATSTRPVLLIWLAVILYPIGITLFCGLMLLKASTAIIAGKETPLTRAIGFLHREYVPTVR